jgi:CheY-like chemotaxis protein
VSNAFIVLSFLVLLTDWRNTIVMLVAGTALASLIYVVISPDPRIPMDLVAQLPAYALIVIGGNLFKFSTEQIDAERKLRATQALAGSIAHEMRHPLGQLKHSLEGMQGLLPPPRSSGPAVALDAQRVHALYRHLGQGQQAVKRGLQVISMTLDEVSARPLDTSAFRYLSAAEVVQHAVEEYSYDSDEARGKVRVTVADDFTFRGDETAFLFVLFNLIKNALYYLGPYPHTQVSITVGNQQVKVRDNGPGIAPDVLPTLFEPFRSVGKAGGTGLGLAYCQRVMRAFDGEIACASVQGQFTEFTMRFPPISEQESEANRLAAVARARQVLAGKRILIVEDDGIQRFATRQKLGPLATTATIEEAEDGTRALELLGRQAYDIVLLDLNMPGLDGYAVADRIRRGNALNCDTRILAYTSEPAHLARAKVLKGGMDGFISKPCAQLPLLAALEQALEQPDAAASAAAQMLIGRRMLLADDSAFNRKAVAAYLRNAGATVIEVDHGDAVLEQLAHDGDFDGVIVDLHMPGMDGLATARAIRSSGQPWAALPVVALTAHSDHSSVLAARAAGMNAFLVKPVEASLLYHTLGPLMARSEAPAATIDPVPLQPLQSSPEEGLLNLHRLESYRRLGMLEELLHDYVPEMSRLVVTLEEAAGQGDLARSVEAMHSLLGMSGEAGALALYQLVRRLYVPMLEQQRWPPEAGWIEQLKALATRSVEALQSYCAAESRAGAA